MNFLEMKHITKSFGAIHALQGVDFNVQAGEAVGLMGDNGAGKSTLMKIIAGNLWPTSGEILVQGKEAAFSNPLDARKLGIEIVYQDLALCDNLTAAANVFLGRELQSGFGIFAKLKHSAMNERSAQLFKELKSETRPKDLVERMSGGQRQAVALARTRLSDPTLVLLDEPTAAISVRQVAEVLARIKQLRDTGHAVILVSHRMGDVFEVCDRVAVLRRGRKIADKPIINTSPEEITGLITGALEDA
jgi:simple sugar transport system ATP-binding protein